MRKPVWMVAALLTLSASLTLTSGVSAQQRVHLMASTSPPYVDRTLPEEGMALELVRHIFSRTPYGVDIGIETWARAIEGARIGIYDGLAVAWYSDARNEDFLFSKPYLDGRLIIVKRRDDPRRFGSLDDLAGGRLGVQVDYAYEIDFSAVPGLELVEENHLIQNLLKLAKGKIDFVIGDRRTMAQQLHEFMEGEVNRFEVLPIELPSRNRHVAASRELKGHADIVAAFNRALEETRKDGSYQAIMRRWDERYPGL
jgi:polar amino acid transport system substrate-binding protein